MRQASGRFTVRVDTLPKVRATRERIVETMLLEELFLIRLQRESNQLLD